MVVHHVFRLTLACIVFFAASGTGVSAQSYDDYKKMVAAKAGNELVGNVTCWQCHQNETHAAMAGEGTVNCEDCHGPGELAVKDLHEEKGRMACNYKTFIAIGDLPKPAQSAICMNCHCENSTFNLHNWNAGVHNLNGVSCIDCHNIHHGADLKPKRDEVPRLCNNCHPDVTAQFMLPSHHPVPEGKLSCEDCHEVHGTPTHTALLNRETVKETCARCHAEKEGPFVFEHAELMEDCTICHTPHGTANDWLLQARMPFLCKQCHPQHRLSNVLSNQRYGTNCTNCHSQIHGTDLSSPSGSGNGRFLR